MTSTALTMPFRFNPSVSLEEYQQLWREELQVLKDSFEALKRPRTKGTVSLYLDELNAFESLEDVWGPLWKGYHPDPMFRKEAENAEQAFKVLIAEVMASSEIAYNLAQFEVAVTLVEPDSQRFLKAWKTDMRKAGAFLDVEAKAAVQRLTVDIAAEITLFLNNIRNDNRYLDFSPEDLKGLPEDFLATDVPNPETGMIRIAANHADAFPILDFCLSQETRKKVHYSVWCRGSPQNEAVLKRLLELRQQKASLLGYTNWAEYQLDQTMMKTPDAAFAFLQTAFEAVKPSSDREKAEASEVFKSQGYGILKPWDLKFGVQLLKEKRCGGFDIKDTRQYFVVRNVIPGLQNILGELFSLRFDKVSETKTWHPTVTTSLVYDYAGGSEVLVGRIFFDLYPREGKLHAACTTTARAPVPGAQLGEVILKANLPSENACISFHEVSTLLHEMGHCVHALLGKQRYARFAGLNCEMDFVEAPSQMLELWLQNKSLFDFAVNEQSRRIPDSVLDQLISAEEIGRAVDQRFQIFLSKVAVSCMFCFCESYESS